MNRKNSGLELTIDGVTVRLPEPAFSSTAELQSGLEKRLANLRIGTERLDRQRRFLLLTLDMALESARGPVLTIPGMPVEPVSVLLGGLKFSIKAEASPDELREATKRVNAMVDLAKTDAISVGDSTKVALYAAACMHDELSRSRLLGVEDVVAMPALSVVVRVEGKITAFECNGGVIGGKIRDKAGRELAFSLTDTLDRDALLEGRIERRGESGAAVLHVQRLIVHE